MIWRLFHAAAKHHGLRLVAPDRPGFGLSDRLPGRKVLDWPDDLARLADHLELSTFPVMAISGGGGYAAAAARRLPGRVSGLGLLSVIGPLDVPDATAGMSLQVRSTYAMARWTPWLLRLIVRSLALVAQGKPEWAANLMERTRPAQDRAVMARPEVRAVLLANLPNQLRDPTASFTSFS